MGDDQASASSLRQRYHAGGTATDDQLSASQLRARHGVVGGTGADKGAGGGINPVIIIGVLVVVVVAVGSLPYGGNAPRWPRAGPRRAMGNVYCCNYSCIGGADCQRPVVPAGSSAALYDEVDPRREEHVIATTGFCSCSTVVCDRDTSEVSSSSSGIRHSRRQEFHTSGGSEAVLSPSSLGAVFKAKHRQSQTMHALRLLNKKRLQGGAWKDDVESLRRLDHPHICKCEDTWEDSLGVYMVLELCNGGNLTDLSSSRERFNETGMAVLMEQMVSAVAHMHENNIVHSDLRPENWLFKDSVISASSELDLNLKMIDFGLASKHGRKGRRSLREYGQTTRISGSTDTTHHHHSRMSTQQSPTHSEAGDMGDMGDATVRLFCVAPEQMLATSQQQSKNIHRLSTVAGEDDSQREHAAESMPEKADCWALGVIAFFMLSGQSPFSLKGSDPATDASFQNARFVFMPTGIWRPVSAEAKHFIALCLQSDPLSRPTAKQLVNLPWMQMARLAGGQGQEDIDATRSRARMTLQDAPLPTAHMILSSFDRMRHFQLIERAAIVATAFKLPSEAVLELWRAFQARDTGGTGMLTLQDLLEVLGQSGVQCTDLVQMVEESGLAQTCYMPFNDFIEDVREFQRNTQDHAIWEVFSLFSKDGSERRVRGSQLVKVLSANQYRQSIAAKFPQASMERIIKDLQDDGDSLLGIDDFKHLVCTSIDPTRRVKA